MQEWVEKEGVKGREIDENEMNKRCSKDEVVNREGRKLVEFLEEKGMGILNGDIKGDEKGEFTLREEEETR